MLYASCGIILSYILIYLHLFTYTLITVSLLWSCASSHVGFFFFFLPQNNIFFFSISQLERHEHWIVNKLWHSIFLGLGANQWTLLSLSLVYLEIVWCSASRIIHSETIQVQNLLILLNLLDLATIQIIIIWLWDLIRAVSLMVVSLRVVLLHVGWS